VLERTGYLAECFWTGVTDSDLNALDRRAAACATAESRSGDEVRYLGSLLIRTDEVVLCFFEGTASSVSRTALCAAIPFERIVETASSPWAEAIRSGTADGHPVVDQ